MHSSRKSTIYKSNEVINLKDLRESFIIFLALISMFMCIIFVSQDMNNLTGNKNNMYESPQLIVSGYGGFKTDFEWGWLNYATGHITIVGHEKFSENSYNSKENKIISYSFKVNKVKNGATVIKHFIAGPTDKYYIKDLNDGGRLEPVIVKSYSWEFYASAYFTHGSEYVLETINMTASHYYKYVSNPPEVIVSKKLDINGTATLNNKTVVNYKNIAGVIKLLLSVAISS